MKNLITIGLLWWIVVFPLTFATMVAIVPNYVIADNDTYTPQELRIEKWSGTPSMRQHHSVKKEIKTNGN